MTSRSEATDRHSAAWAQTTGSPPLDLPPGGPEAADVTPLDAGGRVRGTRVRAGNAMARTRGKLLDAACRLVSERGLRKTSMTDIAIAAGIAKGTLYNHFRSKDEVFAALVEAEVALLAEECQGLGLADALTHAAWRIGTHPAVRRIASDEPAALAALLGSARDGAGWRTARLAAASALAGAGHDPDAADLVTRWLATHLASPDRHDAKASAALLATSLPVAVPPPSVA